MNTLSWILYLADAIGSLGLLTEIGGFLFGAVVFISGGIFIFTINETISDIRKVTIVGHNGYKKYVEQGIETYTTAKRWLKISMSIWFICLLISIVLPSKKTIYYIAASELGEVAIDEITPEANELYQILKDQLTGRLQRELNRGN